MLQYLKKEVTLSMFAALVMGLASFYMFHFTLEQALGASLLVLILFMVVLPIHGHTSTVETSEISDNTTDEYILLEKKFKYVSDKAEKLEIEKKTTEMFLASMSHEIRTPLNGIIGLTDVLDETPLAQEQKEFVYMIRESSNNLRVIVNDILDVSKMNAGKMELESIEFDLFRKLEASAGLFNSQIEEKKIIFNLFTDPQIPHYILGDPTRLSQVIINLVSNAVKFTQEGGSITLAVDLVEQEDEMVTFKISVSDSGIGLTQKQQEKIFEAYSQAEASTARKAGGTGLGLTISSKIVRSMGGELQVQSEEGKGATFFFVLTLPTVKTEGEDEARNYSTLTVGALLSNLPEYKQCSIILSNYIRSFHAHYVEYSKESLSEITPPDILLVDHKSLDDQLLSEIKALSCKRVLLTSSLLHAELDEERKVFEEILFMPVTLDKIATILAFKKEKTKEESIAEVEHEKEEVSEKESAKKNFEELQVLVAEDNPINQKLIKIVLERFGVKVTLVDNGKAAYEARVNDAYDLIFMDIQMPIMGGVESTHQILAYEKEQELSHIPIIALTANALPGDREKYIAEGMDNYATKPLDIKVLEKLVNQYCHIAA